MKIKLQVYGYQNIYMKNYKQLLHKLIGPIIRFLRRFYNKKGTSTTFNKKMYFKPNDYVETRTGARGRVWHIFRKVETNEIHSCSVVWEKEYNGEKISFFMPAEDKGYRFNPLLRRVPVN